MSTINQNGLTISSDSEIREGIINILKGSVGNELYVSDDTPLGAIIAHLADEQSTILQIMEYITTQFDVTKADGVWLENLVRIRGLTKNDASASTVTLNLTGISGVTVPSGSIVSDTSNLYQWETISTVVLTGGIDSVDAICTTTGPITAPAGTLTEIQSTIAGWNTVTNPADAIIGTDKETYPELRARFFESHNAPAGASSIPTLYIKLSELPNMGRLQVFQNRGSVVDAYGVPPGHIHVVFTGASNDDVARTIFRTTDAETYGSTVYSYYDSIVNDTFDISFSIATPQDLYFSFTIQTDYQFQNNPDDIKTKLSEYIASLPIGAFVSYNKLINEAFESVPGITNITNAFLDINPSPALQDDIEISNLKFPVLDVANITIT